MEKILNFRSFVWIILALFTLNQISCKDDTSPPQEQKQAIQLNKTTSALAIGEELVLIPTFTPSVTNPESYKWNVDNAEVVAITINSDHSATVVGKSQGESRVSITSLQGVILASCIINVTGETIENPDDGVVKILTIGNSFSEDAVEYYLYGLAKAAGKNIVIGNLFIGGATLDQHVQNAANNSAAYAYRKIEENGNKEDTPNTTIATALADEDWDYISFQQASPNSGQYNTFVTPLPALYNYVKGKATNPHVKYILHQTWAYAQNSTHAGFANYNKDQEIMHTAIVDAYNRATDLIDTELIVPAGTAIQNGRTSIIGDNFCRDGYHLDLNIGRYTASCTWFEAIFGETVIGNSYKPTALTDYETEIAQHAAHRAVVKPNAVTAMQDYQGGGSGILTNPVFVNFGKDTSSPKWNSVTGHMEDTSIPNLKDDEGNYTGISLTITERFNDINRNGPATTSTDFDMPAGVSSDSYYGNSKKLFNNATILQSVVKLGGLDKTKKYNFCFFASRIDTKVNENRQTKYIVKGQNEDMVLLNAMNNTSNSVCANNIQPNANGEITITVTAGEQNNNANGFYYITALRLSPSIN
ncbi:DUF4886 domain-containing protein [Sphingobacterium corticibacterium]|uniref:DUF4886 domain-containing protein n=1 Tax=Sphingobacterium corticibacterium TaxID=2484746 RepID=A0A4V2DC60_9SPHI|nr:DUF4886 domain-containing protein [Sphingobacterium corticibacterium]RZF60358.1 DUF4886 domain-containing protein [Sphingobacterium corticibacterium]